MTTGDLDVLHPVRYEMAWMADTIKSGAHSEQIGNFMGINSFLFLYIIYRPVCSVRKVPKIRHVPV